VIDVLVLRALGLGDTLAAVPALRALRRAASGRIVLAGPEAPAGLLVTEGIVDEVLPATGLEARGLPSAHTAVNLHGKGPQSHRLLQAPGPARMVAFASRRAGVDGPEWRDDEPERERWCRLIAEAWGVDTDPEDVRLPAPPAPAHRGFDVVLHPGAAAIARRWPVERWIAVAQSLAERRRVAVTGSHVELSLTREVAEGAGIPPEHVLAGSTTVPALAGVVGSAGLVLSGDTGIAHLAYAYGTPSVTIFGPTPPALWGPPSRGPHVALWHGVGVGDPHADRPDPALLKVSAAEVLTACEELTPIGGPTFR
jgi:ADP-heptose:LPS heptosyltransferase